MELLPISALNHMLYCERRAALVHIEQAWADNQFTAEGNILHEKAHDGPDETKAGVRIVRGLPVKSETLGLSGECDVVEFHAADVESEIADLKFQLHGTAAKVIPIEYKRGKPKSHRADEVQLCAQALCLEETLACVIPAGYLFYGQTRRRVEVAFDESLRTLTTNTARRLHEMIASRITPPAVYEVRKCEACSLKEQCLPQAMRFQKGAGAWFDRQMSELQSEI